jgi:hypothetical protein
MKLIATLFLLVTVLTFFSCSKKQDAVVVPIGTISITGIHEADTLKGTISAQIAIAGSTQANKIEVYLNDSLIATGNKAPYNLQWNTLGVTNGNYKLKAIAYDNTGKQTQVALDVIVKNILITLEIDPKINGMYSNVMYIVSDSDGTVLNSIKYNGSDKFIQIGGTHPSLKSRCAVFEVRTDKNLSTYVTGYMSIPKGSIWDLRFPLNNTNPSNVSANLTFSNFPAFKRLTLSSDVYGLTYTSPQNIYPSTGYGFTPTGKLFVQYIDNTDNGYYTLMNIDATKSSSTIDLAANTYKPSLKKAITIAGASLVYPSIYGKYDANYDSYYLLDNAYFQGSNAEYFYPDGVFTQYKASIFYNYNNMDCISTYSELPPQNIVPFGASATVTNSALTNFSFTSQGSIDYYCAVFQNASINRYIQIFSPSTFNSFKFPDILKLTNLSNMTAGDFKLSSFIMFKTPGFNESKLLSYYNPSTFSQLSLPSQSATQYFQ